MGCSGLEGVHNDIEVLLLAAQQSPNNLTTCLRALSKWFLSSVRLGGHHFSRQPVPVPRHLLAKNLFSISILNLP